MKSHIEVVIVLTALVSGFCCSTPTAALRARAIYTDLDNTVLRRSDAQPNPHTVAALHQFQSLGGRVGIATGRTTQQVESIVKELRPDMPLVLFNGAVVVSSDFSKIVAVQSLDPSVVPKVQDSLINRPHVRGVVVHFLRRTVVTSATALAGFLQHAAIRADAVEPDFSHAAQTPTADDPLIKLVVVVDSAEARSLESDLTTKLGSLAHIVLSDPNAACVEVLAPGVNKAMAIRKALAGMDIKLEDLVVFGDSPNDTEMLREFPRSVAMGNCKGSACEAAAARMCRACTADTDAISRVILRYLIGKDDRGDPFGLAPCDCRE